MSKTIEGLADSAKAKATRSNRTKRKPSAKTIANKARRLLEVRRGMAETFAESDQLMAELVEHLGPGKPIDLGGGTSFEIVDPFIDKNGKPCKFWKSTPVPRYDVKVTTGNA